MWPTRPPAPSTRTRELMVGGIDESARAPAVGQPGAAGRPDRTMAGNVAFVFILDVQPS
jgi:hypothetical protein